MSTWFSQSIVYGYKTTAEKFEEIEKDVSDESFDSLLAENNDDDWGWILDDEYAIYDKIVMWGEDYGNDTLLAAESGVVELPKFEKILPVNSMIYEKFPDVMPEDIKYYIVGQYS